MGLLFTYRALKSKFPPEYWKNTTVEKRLKEAFMKSLPVDAVKIVWVDDTVTR